jgi:uncharacterized protein YbaA (DUF1428 family)
MPYVAGYVLPVPKKHLPAYRRRGRPREVLFAS